MNKFWRYKTTGRARYQLWTDDDTRQLWDMHKAKKSMDEITCHFETRTEDAIRNKLNKMGLSLRELSK